MMQSSSPRSRACNSMLGNLCIPRRDRSRVLLLLVLVAALCALLPRPALADATLAAGATVRVSSGSIEAGWHRGRAQLDSRKCWMIKLDKPTQGGYTLLALSFVSAVQVERAGSWVQLPLAEIVRAQPAVCLEEGSD